MIPCNHCGAENPLGTMFCRSCGQKIDVNIGDVMASVKDTKAFQRDQIILGHSRSILTLCLFFFFATGVVHWIMIPDLPPVSMPTPDPMTIEQIMPLEEGNEAAAATLAIGSSDNTLIDWRQANGETIITALGGSVDQIRTWQQSLARSQQPSGAFPGEDIISATALACLALQALPGDPELDAAAQAGRALLVKQGRQAVMGSDRRRTLLWGLALGEAGALTSNYQSTIATLAGTSDPEWGTLTMPLLTTAQQAENLLLLKSKMTKDPLWAHFLDLFTPEPIIESDDESLFTLEAVAKLDGLERWVWAQTAWLRAIRPQDTTGIIASWSATGDRASLPTGSSALGPGADFAFAILAATAPVRGPATMAHQR